MAINPTINIVFAHNDRMAIGAYNAAQRLNRTKDIYFIGIDALPGNNGGIEQVLENKLKATFIYPTNGEKIIQLAMNILQGKPYEKNNTLYTNVVNETNARVLKLQTDAIIEQEDKIKFLNERVDIYMSQYTTQRYLLLSAAIIVVLFMVFLILLFRAYNTPLTLISGPVNSLLADKTINPEQRRLLTLTQKNISVLLKLIDQIIDFRKYENGKLNLDWGFYDLKKQFIEWNESFAEMAKKKHLNFSFSVPDDVDFSMAVDIAKMERIYFNLLSNAFKFTPERGTITVSLDKMRQEEMDFAVIKVANSGKGISETDIRHIFDRFYQVDSHNAGSGIGLALAKAMVELHNGTISVNSETDGWITFTVTIPFAQNEYPAGEIQTHNPSVNLADAEEIVVLKQYPSSESEIFDDPAEENKYRILVVDDNDDIRSYIKTVLNGKQYTVLEANDGEEGFRKAVKHTPDVIVSDIMMPNIDGIELCQKLKSELSTSHIPVILLTACSLDEQRIVGFKSGADDYIAKPFNSDVLEVRIANLIESRKHLKERFRESLFTGNASKEINPAERTFLGKLKELIEKNLSDSELNVEDLGQYIGLSHTQLYRKVKSLTNLSPNELLRIMRLKESYRLLSTTERSVSEIAYDVGFTSPSYFAKCFRDYYNESPTDFLKRVR